ncbi:uncharacterized protein VICG_00713 [Vittaforma corneae ATCC 50505]|uniref:Microsporidial 8TM transmembrane domain-containing protein n=1 Tax=Vittaforma corneae (strain ATCC 50505) TaxID=993615 RepID=L2GN38_VITCO|nr:uncharacterized protein VICG_00713 [Vittaforma corneae ATCC 50505]ELA42313.1 hypothetical protein VICG_00713 [Vittaforma corneae ATCC 50505]
MLGRWSKPLKYFLIFCCRIVDIPSKIFIKDHSKEILLLRDFKINEFNTCLFNILCSLADLLFSLKVRSFDYFLLSSLFPNDLSSLENFIIHFKIQELYPFLCFYEPFYLLKLPSKFSNLFHLNILLGTNLIRGRSVSLLNSLSTVYLNGLNYCHFPSLSGFWYLLMCMVEQYSGLSYTLNLIYGNFLSDKDPRLIPVYKNGSSFISYLPFILKSKFLNLYFAIALVFEYLYMNFKCSEIVNTNFLYWTSLLFVSLYIWDLKFGSLSNAKTGSQ